VPFPSEREEQAGKEISLRVRGQDAAYLDTAVPLAIHIDEFFGLGTQTIQ
jgi:hypothetical protein